MPTVYVNQFTGLTHLDALPLAAGQIVSAARNNAAVNDAFDFEILIERRQPDKTVERYEDPALLAFSCYPWSSRYSLEVARRAKVEYPECLCVVGGPAVPRRSDAIERFFRQNEAVDVLIMGEGELAFTELLETVSRDGNLSDVPGLALRSEDTQAGCLVTASRNRIEDFSKVPSPYLDGTFDQLIEQSGSVFTAALLETNRGCPFSCAFCDWGQATRSAVHELPIDRVFGELEWVAENGIPYVYIVDANFGIRKRDAEIARFVAELKRRSGQPQYFFFHLRKNARERDLSMVETLIEAEVGCQVTLSTQDFDTAVLSAIARSNIDAERSLELRRACNERQIPTFNELLIGLPEQTLDSFRDTVVEAISPYPGDSFFLYPCRLVENAALASPEFREKYSIETRLCEMTSSNPIQREYHVKELEEIVVATSSMPQADWQRAIELGYLAVASVNLALLDVVIRYIQSDDGLDLHSFLDAFADGVVASEEGSALAALRSVLDEFVSSILAGGPLFLEVESAYNTRLRVADALACAALEGGDRFFDEVCALTKSLAQTECDSEQPDNSSISVSEVVKKSFEGLEVEEREVPAPQSYSLYVEDDGFLRDNEIGSLGRFTHSLSDELITELFRFQRFATPTMSRKKIEEETFEHDWLGFCQSKVVPSAMERVQTTLRYRPPYYLVGASSFGQFALGHLAATYTRRGIDCVERV